jgi:hypothetical protein
MSYRSRPPGRPGTSAGFWPLPQRAFGSRSLSMTGWCSITPGAVILDLNAAPPGWHRWLSRVNGGGARPGVSGCADRGPAAHPVALCDGEARLVDRRLAVAPTIPAAVMLPGRRDLQRFAMAVAFASGVVL